MAVSCTAVGSQELSSCGRAENLTCFLQRSRQHKRHKIAMMKPAPATPRMTGGGIGGAGSG
eukprot:scaffold162302_cov32-Tisochrysis_lutea.AAC.1